MLRNACRAAAQIMVLVYSRSRFGHNAKNSIFIYAYNIDSQSPSALIASTCRVSCAAKESGSGSSSPDSSSTRVDEKTSLGVVSVAAGLQDKGISPVPLQ